MWWDGMSVNLQQTFMACLLVQIFQRALPYGRESDAIAMDMESWNTVLNFQKWTNEWWDPVMRQRRALVEGDCILLFHKEAVQTHYEMLSPWTWYQSKECKVANHFSQRVSGALIFSNSSTIWATEMRICRTCCGLSRGPSGPDIHEC